MHQENGIWVSTEDLNRDEKFLQSANQEFSIETLAEEESPWVSSRRDFLKFLGFGVGAATLAASCEIPVRKAIPYVTKPDDIVPGVANYFASSVVEGGDYCAVLVKTREGRPIKIEGNTLSTITKGGTSARAQASVLSLYDTRRFKGAGAVNKDGKLDAKDWKDIDGIVKSKLAGAGNIRVISNTVMSPTAKAAMAEFLAKYPSARHIMYDAVSCHALLEANNQCFGVRAVPSYHFDKAKVVVSFGADFLGSWISPVEYAGDYAKMRRIVDVKNASMSRHYQVESHMSLTGSNADHRILVKPSEQGAAVVALYNEIAGLSGGASVGGPKVNDKANAAIKKAAADLWAAQGASLVVSASNNIAEQTAVNLINSMLGNINNTIEFNRVSNQRQGNESEMRRVIEEMKAGQVGAVIIWGANPAYDFPGFDQAMARVGFKLSLNMTADETTVLCDYVAPMHHQLESWGDAEPQSGKYSLIQPTIAPLFKTRQAEHSFLVWADSAKLSADAQPYYAFLKNNWETTIFGKQSTYATPSAFWDMSLHDGVLETTVADSAVALQSGVSLNASGVTQPSNSEIEISFYETVNVGSGQYAHNPWLQEMPDPVTRTVWENCLSIPVEWDGINRIFGWKELADGDQVEVEVGGQKMNCTVVRTFGQMPGTVAIALGQGRRSGGCGVGHGVDVNPWLPVEGGLVQYFAKDAKVSDKIGVQKDFACVQHHHTMGVKAMGTQEGKVINADEKALGWNGFQGSLTERSILKSANFKDLPKLVEEVSEFRKEAHHLNSQTLYPDRSAIYGNGVHWGMFVDVNACTGCGACQVACVAENNVPVVGKNEVKRHHEMTWMRIDRYFYGSFENPNVVYQPMMCQHCENAPCENVCPVAATSHSMEGINQMAYNRCIGTRYCANNCPYKVRRFNWLDYTTADLWPGNEERSFTVTGDDKPFYADNLTRMVLNPDVTVRSRGVIEKCSFCIQRIQEGKLAAKQENRKLTDNDVRSACQTACPTGAIVFGNVNNPESQVSKLNQSPLAFKVLEEINVQSNVLYTAKIKNQEESLLS